MTGGLECVVSCAKFGRFLPKCALGVVVHLISMHTLIFYSKNHPSWKRAPKIVLGRNKWYLESSSHSGALRLLDRNYWTLFCQFIHFLIPGLASPRPRVAYTCPPSLCLPLWAGMCGACSSCRRISLSAVKWPWLTGLRKVAGGTGAEEAWLTDWWLSGYVESLRGDERRRLQFHYSPSLVTDTGPPPVNSPYISLWPSVAAPSPATTCCRLRLLSVIPLHTLTFSLFIFSSPPLHRTSFCSHVSYTIWMQQLPPSSFALDPASPSPPPPAPLFNGFLTTLRGWVGAGVSLVAAFPRGRNVPL